MKHGNADRWIRTVGNERGSASIESTIVLPLLLLVSLLLMIGALYMFQSEWTYSSAAVTADRTAHTWDNSFKHPVTGMYVPIQQDPLYWRLFHDGAEAWFTSDISEHDVSIDFPRSIDENAELAPKKLAKGAAALNGMLQGKASFLNKGWRRIVKVEASHPFRAPGVMGIRWRSATEGSSTETVVEPAEFIRNIDLLRSYLLAIDQKWEPGTIRNLLSPWLHDTNYSPSAGRKLQFAVHAEAVRYLRTLVKGRESRFSTEGTGKWRLVDALDGQGISHQAYLGPKGLNTDMRGQLLKDVELIRTGKVKGVVWHFFQRKGSESVGPNPALQKELKKYGIAIVVHT